MVPDRPLGANQPVVLIMLALRDDQLDHYKQLKSDRTHVAFRNSGHGISDPQLQRWDAEGQPYYFTSASSDFPAYARQPLYASLDDVPAALERPANEGLYLHELVTYLAAQHEWRWDQAADAVDWTWVESAVAAARLAGKKVVWSEAGRAWDALDRNPRGHDLLQHAGDTIVVTFATNFDSPRSGFLMHAAADDARGAAVRHAASIGESHQGWHFRDRDTVPTREGSLDLARFGQQQNATYYQFEGTPDDLDWDSPYMLGVRDFVTQIQTSQP